MDVLLAKKETEKVVDCRPKTRGRAVNGCHPSSEESAQVVHMLCDVNDDVAAAAGHILMLYYNIKFIGE